MGKLYPPQFLSTVAPAFITSQGCRIHFSISSNLRQNIKQLHLTLTDQKTNASALKKETYRQFNMIKLYGNEEIYQEVDWNGEDKYFIIISPDDLEGNQFEPNKFYKVQIRFSQTQIQTGADIYNQLNQSSFSEWSTVCLIRGMSSEPILSFTQFPNNGYFATLSSIDLELHGSVEFTDGDQQKLKSFQIKLYDDAGRLLEDSKQIDTNEYYNSNTIHYTFQTQLEQNKQYIFTVQILTNFYYEYASPKKFSFEIVEPDYPSSFTGNLQVIPENELGYLSLIITSTQGSSNLVNLKIRRTSSESNFKIWEQVHAIPYQSEEALNYTWNDFTVKSGIYYKYAVHVYDSRNRIGLITLDEPRMVVFDSIFLISEDKQLTVKFNPEISSFAYNVAEGKTDTIGSKYPYFRRNGSMYYRQFPLSGTITHFMDIKGNLMQASREEIYRDATSLYEQYNFNNGITPYDDYIYERQFRQKVIDFLYKNDVKLFKSTTEGNILVKISDINFTPNTTLSRMIYDFSCTCYEIAEATFKNIQSIGSIVTVVDEFETQLQQTQEHYGQIIRPDPSFTNVNNQTYFKAGQNIMDLLLNKYQTIVTEDGTSYHNIGLQNGLNYLRIQMLEKPYLINMDTLTPIKYTNSAGQVIEQETVESKNTVLGYLVDINGIGPEYRIYINPTGRYEFSDNNLDRESANAFKITSVSFPKDTQAIIDYKVDVTIKQDISKLPISISTKETIGQLFGTFNLYDSIYRLIYNKYYSKELSAGTDKVSELTELSNLWGVRVTGRPGLAFQIKDTPADGLPQITFLNDTGMLEFYDTETSVTWIKFLGYHVDERILKGATENQREQEQKDILSGKNPLRKGQCLVTNITVSNLENQKYNIEGIVLKYKNKDYIFYDKNWFPIDLTTHIVQVPKVEAMIDYYAEIMTKTYEV